MSQTQINFADVSANPAPMSAGWDMMLKLNWESEGNRWNVDRLCGESVQAQRRGFDEREFDGAVFAN